MTPRHILRVPAVPAAAMVLSAAVVVSAIAAPAAAADEALPVRAWTEPPPSPVDFHFMTRGEPADSLVLRVSLCFTRGRCCGTALVVVEELSWPPPPPTFVIDTGDGPQAVNPLRTEDWWRRAVTIDGGVLDAEGEKLPPPPPPAGMPVARPGRLGVPGQRPLRGVTWLSPREFVVASDLGRYTIRWVGPGQLALVGVERVR